MAFVIHSPEMKIEKNSEKLRNKSPKITAEEKMKIGKNLPHGSARGKFIQLFVCVLNVVVVVIRFLSLMSTKIALSQKLFFRLYMVRYYLPVWFKQWGAWIFPSISFTTFTKSDLVFNVSDQHAYVHHISFSTLNSFSLISYQLRARRKRFFSSLCFLFSIFPFTFIFLFYQLKACVYCCFFNPHQFEILFGWLIFVLQLGWMFYIHNIWNKPCESSNKNELNTFCFLVWIKWKHTQITPLLH